MHHDLQDIYCTCWATTLVCSNGIKLSTSEGKDHTWGPLISNEVKQLEFKAIPEVAYKNDPVGALSMIPPKVVMIQDVRKCYNCKVGSVGDMELRDAYDKLCDNGVLKEEYNIVEKKGLTRALDFLTTFKMEWIKIVLSWIHDGYIWLEGGIVKIKKRVIHRFFGFPTLDRPQALRSDAKEIIVNNIGARWNKKGMTIDTITNPLVNFVVRVISHTFYQ